MLRAPVRCLPLPVLLALLALAAAPARGQLAPLAEGGARALALGGAGVALGEDPWGTSNPAAWATLTGATAGVFASQAFGMPELRLVAAAVAYPLGPGTIAASARTYGFKDFREGAFGLGMGRAVRLSPTRRLHVGAVARYTSVEIPGFGSAGVWGGAVGVLAEGIPGLTFGAHALNPHRPALSPHDPLHARLDLGLAYRPDPRALLAVAASQDPRHPLSARAGLELAPVPALRLRGGVASAPTRLATGVGVTLDRLRADVAVDRHEALGWTTAFEVGVVW